MGRRGMRWKIETDSWLPGTAMAMENIFNLSVLLRSSMTAFNLAGLAMCVRHESDTVSG